MFFLVVHEPLRDEVNKIAQKAVGNLSLSTLWGRILIFDIVAPLFTFSPYIPQKNVLVQYIFDEESRTQLNPSVKF